jgi:glyceraldehyde 3-phosphate dehydrogenase
MAEQEKMTPFKLGINGLGRIAKLTIWHHAERQYFSELVVNIGREVGSSLGDIAHFIENDSTYGALHAYLYGCRASRVIEELDEANGTMRINGIKTTFLRTDRNPARIGWRARGVDIVVDATGAFLDPTAAEDDPKGSLRGHLVSGAKKVIASAPFKIKDKNKAMPGDSVTTVMGINDEDYDPKRHVFVSNASCTTTCLAYMIKPLLDSFGAKQILSASMSTVHAATSSQQVLDRAPKAKASDLRKTRGVFNNIILTSTGAAKALGLVIPEMKNIGFIAESVRVPVTTGSLIILMVLLQDKDMRSPITRAKINDIYRNATDHFPKGYLLFSENQNVSSDIVGTPRAAAVIEGNETHTRTAAVRLDLKDILDQGVVISQPSAPGGEKGEARATGAAIHENVLTIPVTQAVIYGWYDNELGSYTNMLGDRTVSIARML